MVRMPSDCLVQSSIYIVTKTLAEITSPVATITDMILFKFEEKPFSTFGVSSNSVSSCGVDVAIALLPLGRLALFWIAGFPCAAGDFGEDIGVRAPGGFLLSIARLQTRHT